MVNSIKGFGKNGINNIHLDVFFNIIQNKFLKAIKFIEAERPG